jgi:hypothetical protein
MAARRQAESHSSRTPDDPPVYCSLQRLVIGTAGRGYVWVRSPLAVGHCAFFSISISLAWASTTAIKTFTSVRDTGPDEL